jgi:hypothetical protein
VKVVVLMIEVVAMIEPAVIEMAFAPSKVADSGTNGAGRMGTTAATAHMATTPGAGVGASYACVSVAPAAAAASMGASAATAAATVAAAPAAPAAAAAAATSDQL